MGSGTHASQVPTPSLLYVVLVVRVLYVGGVECYLLASFCRCAVVRCYVGVLALLRARFDLCRLIVKGGSRRGRVGYTASATSRYISDRRASGVQLVTVFPTGHPFACGSSGVACV